MDFKEKEQYWKDNKPLHTPSNPLDLSFWRFVIHVNWSKHGLWSEVTAQGDLRTVVCAIDVTKRIDKNKKILSMFRLTLLKLNVNIGFITNTRKEYHGKR